MTILVIAEHNDAQLKSSTLNALKAAFELGSEVDVLVAGHQCDGAAKAAAAIAGVRKVLVADDPALGHCLPEALTDAVQAAQCAGGYSHILFAAGTAGKAAMPRTAAKLGVSALTEIAGVVSADTFKRYIYAGSVLATVKTTAVPVVATVRSTSFEAVSAEGGSAAIEPLAVSVSSRGFAFVSLEEVKSDRPDLLTAKRVVAGGRGLFDEEGFAALDKLADKMGAAVGSTRAVVDMSLVSSETQIGQTGKIVAPELYMAFGISGAIQHVAGMKDSKVIVAVNKDAEAPIFEMSDYYLEADAVEVIKELTDKI